MKLIYHVATSLDGYIAGTKGEIDGFLQTGTHIDDFQQDMKAYDLIIMGRKTYEIGYRYGLKFGDIPYAGYRHLVFSRTLKLPPQQTSDLLEITADNPAEKITILKRMNPEGNIWLCGGGNIAGQLLNAGLIDSLILKVNPFIMGKGIPLFGARVSSSNAVALQHTKTQTYANGVHVMHYVCNKSS